MSRTGKNTVRASSEGCSKIEKARLAQKWVQDTDSNNAPLQKAKDYLDPSKKLKEGFYPDGINQTSWKFFCSGKFCSLNIFQVYCEILDIKWYDVIDWEAISDKLLLNINIPFNNFESSQILNPLLRWHKGAFVENQYKITKEGILIITAAGDSDYSDDTNSAPIITYPIKGDFDAEVKVKFSSRANYQRASFGVRSTLNMLYQSNMKLHRKELPK